MDRFQDNPFLVEARALTSHGDRVLLSRQLPELARQASDAGDSWAAALLWLESATIQGDATSTETLEWLGLAEQEAAKAGEPEVAARACLEHAVRLEALGRLHEAVEWAKRGDAWAEASGNRLVWGLVLLTLSRLFRWTGRLVEAQQASEMAVAMGHEDGISSLVLFGLIALAEARLASGQVFEAEEAALGAASLAPDGVATRVYLLLLQAACALRSGRPNAARALMAAARTLLSEGRFDPSALAGADLLDAQVAVALGDWGGAREALSRVTTPESGLDVLAGVDLLSVLAASGERDDASRLMRTLVRRVHACPIPRLRVLTLVQIGMVAWTLQRTDEAMSFVREALDLAATEAPDLVAPARVLLDEMLCNATSGPGQA